MVLQQYFRGKAKHQYIPVATFADNFQKTDIAKQQMQYLEQPYKAPNKKCEEALITHHYALPCRLSIPLFTVLNDLHASSFSAMGTSVLARSPLGGVCMRDGPCLSMKMAEMMSLREHV